VDSDYQLSPVILRKSRRNKSATVPPEEVERREGSPEGSPTTTSQMDPDDILPPLVLRIFARKKAVTAPPPKAPEGPLTTIVTPSTVSQMYSDVDSQPLCDWETKTLPFPHFSRKPSFDAEIYTTTPHPSSTSAAPTTFTFDTDRIRKTKNKTTGTRTSYICLVNQEEGSKTDG